MWLLLAGFYGPMEAEESQTMFSLCLSICSMIPSGVIDMIDPSPLWLYVCTVVMMRISKGF